MLFLGSAALVECASGISRPAPRLPTVEEFLHSPLRFVGGGIAAALSVGSGSAVPAVPPADAVEGSTTVLTADRINIPICELEAGTLILSVDEDDEMVCTRVVDVSFRVADPTELCYIIFADDETMCCTRGHMFFVADKRWCCVEPSADSCGAGILRVGDCICDANHSQALIVAIEDVLEQIGVYNLVTEGHGSWFANGLKSYSSMTFSTNSELKESIFADRWY